MFRKIFIFSSLFLYLSLSFGVYALSNTQKGAILDMFKKKQYDLLFESDLGNVSGEQKEIFGLYKKLNLFDNIKTNIVDERQDYENKSLENLKKIISLEEQIKSLDEDIENSSTSILKLNNKIIDTKKEVDSTKEIVDMISKKITENREILLKYLVYIYKKSNTIYSEDEIDNLKSIILNGENISDLLNDLHFKGIIEITGKQLIDKHRSYISELYLKKVELEKKESSLKKMRKALIVGRKVLKDKKEFKESLLKISKGKQSLYKKYIDDKIELEKSIKLRAFKEKMKFNNVKDNLLEKYNCKFVDVTKNTIEFRGLDETCLTLNKVIYAESKLKGFTNEGTNLFSWPINPVYGLSAYFSDKNYKDKFGTNHDAIDIITEQGTSVKAPEDGYVIFIEPPTSPDYSFMAIKHPDGYVSVYGHLSEILVKEFDFVKKGQTIAKTGGEYGTNGAGYLTTGPHLHFEIYKDKKFVDPLNFLSLAEIPYKYLKKEYRFKFYIDYKEKKGYEYKYKTENTRTFKLEGDTEVERQKSLINKYAVGTFRNWQMWVDESLDGNIDPTFTMCIGLAETGLGNYLKTPYNVGNIGNTDSGATKSLKNARSGVYAMISTLNNKYLGNYNEIRQLSRYGNKDGAIYASSPDHWHNNIIKCMSHIKGRYIPDDYNFRIMN